MAIRNTENLPGAIRSTDRLVNTRCVLRCIEEVFDKAKGSDNMMITREWEVVMPEIVVINGENKCLAGSKLKQYLTTIVIDDETGKRNDAKSDKALARLRDENKVLGLSHNEIDDENPALDCEGVMADGTVGSEEYSLKEPATPEEIALGKKVGKDRIGADGKPEKGYRLKLVGILGLSNQVGAGGPRL